MTAAYIAARAAMGTVLVDGPLKGRSMAGGGVEVIRAVEHAPITIPHPLFPDDLPGTELTMTITGSDQIAGIPHFASGPLSRYHPVNGLVSLDSIEI